MLMVVEESSVMHVIKPTSAHLINCFKSQPCDRTLPDPDQNIKAKYCNLESNAQKPNNA